jgi:carbonic anhydrase
VAKKHPLDPATSTAPEPSASQGITDDLLERNAAYAREMSFGDLPAPPSMRIAVVACMDARMDVHRILGIEPGDAHVIRNAGGVVTRDVLRSLAVSQHALGTRELMLMYHSECGMLGLDEEALKQQVEAKTGHVPDVPLMSITNLEDDLRASIARVENSGFLRFDFVRGFLYDVRTGLLKEI